MTDAIRSVERLQKAPRLELDAGGNPIPCMSNRPGKAHHITAGATHARNTKPFDPATRVIGIFADGGDVYIEFGGSNVQATNTTHWFPGDLYYNFTLREGVTHVSVLRAGSSDVPVHISEMW